MTSTTTSGSHGRSCGNRQRLDRRHRHRRHRSFLSFVLPVYVLHVAATAFVLSLLSSTFIVNINVVDAVFHHNSCTSDVAKQFQFSDCYLPDLADDLLLKDAGFLMSHDAATGYLKRNNLYTKNQIGDVYEQLDDGARALDVRPKLLQNGTVVLHHGAVPIAVLLETLVDDARRWSMDNPDELVLIFHSNLAYPSSSSSSSSSSSQNNANEDDNDAYDDAYDDDYVIPSADTAVAALSQVYASLGVTYVECADLYGLTVGEAKELALLSVPYSSGNDDDNDNDNDNDDDGQKQEQGGDDDNDNEGESTRSGYVLGRGYLLAMDRHDAYAGSCAKQNYLENSIVTCYSNNDDILPCTDRKSIQHQKLKDYALASANNEPTDNDNVLGPPASTYYYPFNEIQTLWQVDGVSAALGVSHVSSIIDDNTKSHLNARIVDWIYDDAFDEISLLVVDHVRLNGNALSSVLRNRCGQSELSYDQYNHNDNNNDNGNNDNDNGNGNGNDNNEDNFNNYNYNRYEIPCGTAVGKPQLRQGKPLSTLSFFVTVMVCAVFGVWIAVFLAHYRKHYDHKEEVKILERDFQAAIYQCGCSSSGAATGGATVVDSDIDVSEISGNNKGDPLLLSAID